MPELEVKGFSENVRILTKLRGDMINALGETLESLGTEVVDEAQRLAPVRTGLLRASIAMDVRKAGIMIYALAPYAPFVEFGTTRMVARPFMRPALMKTLSRFPQLFAQRIRI